MIIFALESKKSCIMKKILFSLIALMAVMTVQAQTICGSWQNMESEVTSQKSGSYAIFSGIYTFNEDGTFSTAADYTLSTKPARTKAREVAYAAYVKGTYRIDGEKVVMNYDLNSMKVELVSVSENGRVVSSPAKRTPYSNDEIKSKLANVFKNKTCVAQFNVDGSMLQLTDMNDGKMESLIRIVTLKN